MRHLNLTMVLTAGAICLAGVAHADCGNQLHKILPIDDGHQLTFGWFISFDGATAVVGAPASNDNGVFSGSAFIVDTTTGQQVFKLLPSDGARRDSFGQDVAISGTTTIVGAINNDDNGDNSGSAYIFDAATGQQVFKLLPNDGAAEDWFGFSVAIDGDIAVIGAPQDDDNGSASGSAYIFDATTGQQLFKLLPDDGMFSDQFGIAVAVSGDIAVVGSWQDDDLGNFSGAAYLFDVTSGAQIAKILPEDGHSAQLFGRFVSISGTTALISAHGEAGFIGAAYLFDVSDAQNPMQRFKLEPEAGVQMNFGWSVAVEGTTAIIGAFRDSHNNQATGSAYLYDTITGELLVNVFADDGADDDEFGVSVGVSGDIAVVGARLHDDNRTDAGAVYVFALDGCGGGGGCTRNPAWQCDGDVDGDGQVNPVDAGLVQAAFGSLDAQDLCNYDFDCDGQINPVDGGIVQSLFGTCDAPRSVCP